MNPAISNAWDVSKQVAIGFIWAMAIAGAAWLLFVLCSCAPLPTGPAQGDPGVVCGILIGGTDGGGTYSPTEACRAVVDAINANPYCIDAGHIAKTDGCGATFETVDGGACEGAKYFCATGVDSIGIQLEASGCDVSKVTRKFVCYPSGGK